MSTNQRFIDALKQGILLERKGKAFYTVAAQQAVDSKIREFFQEMADEESYHDSFLSQIFSNYNRSGYIDNIDFSGADIRKATRTVIDSDLIGKITSAGYEAAAIAAAIEMEKKSIELYSEQALTSTEPEEKKMFEFLADWEGGHLAVLVKINQEIQEKVWFDNNFWPF